MSEWQDISQKARDVMEELGNFGPTVNVKDRCLKGWSEGEKCYWTSADLREIAGSFIEVADWLDARADAAPPEGGEG